MFKILFIPNAETFLSLISRSRGDVLLHLPDGSRCSLKRDHTAQQMLQVTQPGRNGISISFSDPGDAPAFFQYLVEMAR